MAVLFCYVFGSLALHFLSHQLYSTVSVWLSHFDLDLFVLFIFLLTKLLDFASVLFVAVAPTVDRPAAFPKHPSLASRIDHDGNGGGTFTRNSLRLGATHHFWPQ